MGLIIGGRVGVHAGFGKCLKIKEVEMGEKDQ